MISELAEQIRLKEVLVDKDNFHPFSGYKDREYWEGISEELKVFYLNNAEKYVDYSFPPLKATLYMDFIRNGNRSRYEKVCFERRNVISTLLVAECIEGKGRFIDDIVNGVWAICEETSWVIPAHNNIMQPKGNALPDIENGTTYIDLFAAETASLLTWVYYFLKEALDAQSPLICSRIMHEMKNRIIKPFLSTDKMHWMGQKGQQVNNWTPWINSNLLPVFLLMEEDEDIRLTAIEKSIKSVDIFIDGYSADGGCDEGPGYWNVAGGSLFDFLDVLFEATNGMINIYQEEKIRNIGSFVYKAHIGNNYFVNFADASVTARPAYDLVYRMGKCMNDLNMINFGASMFNLQKHIDSGAFTFFRKLKCLQVFDEISSLSLNPPLLGDVWLPDLQFTSARETQGSINGLYYVAKGGHNNESHNHNDVGSFMVFYNGTPVLIDAGVEAYTSKTFSSKRYEMWTMQSSYHNLPEINGYMQLPGVKYCAKDVCYSLSDERSEFSLDLKDTYPSEAGIVSWKRSFNFNKIPPVTLSIKEVFEMEVPTNQIVLNYLTSQKITIQDGTIIFQLQDGTPLKMDYNSDLLNTGIDEIKLEDEQLKNSWKQDSLYRLKLLLNKDLKKGEFVINIHK